MLCDFGIENQTLYFVITVMVEETEAGQPASFSLLTSRQSQTHTLVLQKE